MARPSAEEPAEEERREDEKYEQDEPGVDVAELQGLHRQDHDAVDALLRALGPLGILLTNLAVTTPREVEPAEARTERDELVVAGRVPGKTAIF